MLAEIYHYFASSVGTSGVPGLALHLEFRGQIIVCNDLSLVRIPKQLRDIYSCTDLILYMTKNLPVDLPNQSVHLELILGA